MANGVNTDQTAPQGGQSDLGLHCLLMPACSNLLGKYIWIYFYASSVKI